MLRQQFYETDRGKTTILARFVPIVHRDHRDLHLADGRRVLACTASRQAGGSALVEATTIGVSEKE